MRDFKFFVCRDSIKLGKRVARILGKRLGKLHLTNFADGEIRVWVEEKVKGKDCVVLQTTRINPHNRLMELCLVVSALKTAGAEKILAVIPSFGYARQFMVYQPGEVNAALIAARFLEKAGISKIILIDVHSEKVLDFFKAPAINLKTLDLFAQEIKRIGLRNFILVAPDAGSKRTVAALAKKINAPHVWLEKKRKTKGWGKEDWSRAFGLSGKVKGQNAIVVDDEISSGGTVANAAKILKQRGVRKVYVFVTHPVFSSKTFENLPKAGLEKIFVTDTIPLENGVFKKLPNLEVVSVANLLAEEIEKQI
jgi:ribose-phosphate pyrophosphokinase